MQDTNKNILKMISSKQYRWLITGVAGFIGSNLLEYLLRFDQIVVGIDNLSSGSKKNLNEIKSGLSKSQCNNFTFIHGDIRRYNVCEEVCKNIDFVLHHAAIVSVPESFENPILTHDVNITGFQNIIIAASKCKIKRLIYASSSAVYGDTNNIAIKENFKNSPISPYGFSKYVNEIYANFFSETYGLHTTGLRYFNVFGKRQNDMGGYAAVIPKWINSLINNNNVTIYGDGEATRDYCYVMNIVEANVLSCLSDNANIKNKIYNISQGHNVSLIELFETLKEIMDAFINTDKTKIIFNEYRLGDIKHSYADISKAKSQLNYSPKYDFKKGLLNTINWHLK